MEYIYAAMLLHSAGKQVTEEAVTSILSAVGIKPDEFRIKTLVDVLIEVDIDEALRTPIFAVIAPIITKIEEKPVEATPKREEKKEEDEQGLSALFR